MLDRIEAAEGISTIQVNEKLAAYKITRHLIKHGYQNIGIICGPNEMLNTQDRLNGWKAALTEAELSIQQKWILSGNTPVIGVTKLSIRCGKRDSRSYFATNELQAFGCLKALAELKLRVPEDIALVCFNGTVQSEYTVPTLTTVRQPVDKIAQKRYTSYKIGRKKKPFVKWNLNYKSGTHVGADYLLFQEIYACDYRLRPR